MRTLDDLLLRFEDGDLPADELAEMKRLLGDAEARAALVRHFHASAAIAETLREEAAAAAAGTQAGPATERMRALGRSIRANAAVDDGPGRSALPARERLRHRPHPAPAQRPGRVVAHAGTAVALVLVATLVATLVIRQRAQQAPEPAGAVLAMLDLAVEAEGDFIVPAQPGQARRRCAPGMELRAGDRLDATAVGVTLRFADEATVITVATGTRLALGESPGRREVRLEAGSLDAVVAKQPAGRALVFLTDQAEARVIGTRLSLSTGAAGTRLAVSEGRVRLQSRADGASLEVAAGGAAVASAAGVRREAGPAVAARLLPANGCLWGASLRGEPQAARQLAELEAGSRRAVAVVHQFMAFSDYDRERLFPSATQRSWVEGGRLLAIAWKPRIGEQQLKWADVAEGRYDAAYVDVLARKSAAWGRPYFLAIHHDPEELVGPPGSGMTAADFVRMWRHIHQRFAAAGAGAVAWVWTMSGAPASSAQWNDLYPGDDCVDWLSCSAYNNAHTEQRSGSWRGFTELVTPFVSWARGDFRGDHAKPIMIAVYACAENPDGEPGKEAWFRTLPQQLQRLPEIRALIYFHDRTLRADTTPAALAGFAASAGDPCFRTAPPILPPAGGGAAP